MKTKYAALDEKKQNEALANIVTLDDIDIERTELSSLLTWSQKDKDYRKTYQRLSHLLW